MTIPLQFVPRDEILEPIAVFASEQGARALGNRLLINTDEQLQKLTAIATPDLLMVFGESENLPWVDSARYLGRDARAPRILLPTNLQPNGFAIDVFEQALLRHTATIAAPVAVLLEPRRVISVAEARPIERERLTKWLEGKT